MARKLYVGNLPFSAGEAELQELFAQAGAGDSVKVMRDMATGRARGFGGFGGGGGGYGGGGGGKGGRREPRW